eukprot:TRINITY_DN16756_c6_g1_i1.p1 TRINITY_DN16756_c6_g1~~TRINITY_DN16756_c6_g1_i1.p1  ORF type:complete len:282 (+),score=36.57 TRINITY_DN16756_c6_g1_i1:92-847(+)
MSMSVMPTFKSRAEFGEILSKMNFTVGVELGVQRGAHSELLLSKWLKCRRFLLVDVYKDLVVRDSDAKYAQVQAGKDAQLEIMLQRKIKRRRCTDTFEQALKDPKCGTKLELCKDYTHECAKLYPDESFDFIYVDALHDRKSALRDIRTWWPKLKPGGIMAGHDYMDHNAYIKHGFRKARVRYSKNYDGTPDETMRFAKGAVDDFFSCAVSHEHDNIVQRGLDCSHARQVIVAHDIDPVLDDTTPSWAVRK